MSEFWHFDAFVETSKEHSFKTQTNNVGSLALARVPWLSQFCKAVIVFNCWKCIVDLRKLWNWIGVIPEASICHMLSKICIYFYYFLQWFTVVKQKKICAFPFFDTSFIGMLCRWPHSYSSWYFCFFNYIWCLILDVYSPDLCRKNV